MKVLEALVIKTFDNEFSGEMHVAFNDKKAEANKVIRAYIAPIIYQLALDIEATKAEQHEVNSDELASKLATAYMERDELEETY